MWAFKGYIGHTVQRVGLSVWGAVLLCGLTCCHDMGKALARLVGVFVSVSGVGVCASMCVSVSNTY